MKKIIDAFSFCGEFDLLEIRFNILDSLVDRFVIVEGKETFSGQPKPLYWEERDKERFKKWESKVVYLVPTHGENKRIKQLLEARLYASAPPFKRSFYQKEYITEGLLDLSDEDIIYYGDVDEIWKPKEIDNEVYKLKQLCYSYYLNNRSSEDWRGTIITKYKNLRNGCLNDMRANPQYFLEDGGWHFTNMGGVEAVLKKIQSYDHCDELNFPWIREGMAKRIEENKDFIGRNKDWTGKPFEFWIDDSDLPEYLLLNKEKYKSLWK